MLTSYKPVFIGALASNLNGHAWVIDGIHEKLVTKDGASKKQLFFIATGDGVMKKKTKNIFMESVTDTLNLKFLTPPTILKCMTAKILK